MLKLRVLVRLLKPCSFRRRVCIAHLGSGHRGPAALSRRRRVGGSGGRRARLGSVMAKNNDLDRQRSFGNLAIDRFLQHCHVRTVAPKAVLIKSGDIPDTLYFVVEGSVAVIIEDAEGTEIVLAYLNRGEFFGEM